ncbi:MAG: LytR C-terminal domain-containing protein [Actinomycetota bacterium]
MSSDWIMISATIVMFVSLFGALGLLLVAWRRQGILASLKAREQHGLGNSAPVASDRLQALAGRDGTSQGGLPMPSSTGNGATIGIIAGVLAIIVVGGFAGWWFLVRGDGSSTTAGTVPITKPANGPLGADPDATVPEDPPAIQDRAAYTVAVLNASGVTGAAADRVAPKVETAGYRVGQVGDANDQNLAKTVVMWRPGKQAVAQNVAKDLGITRAPPIDGVASDAIGDADVVVVVGKDTAAGP